MTTTTKTYISQVAIGSTIRVHGIEHVYSDGISFAGIGNPTRKTERFLTVAGMAKDLALDNRHGRRNQVLVVAETGEVVRFDYLQKVQVVG